MSVYLDTNRQYYEWCEANGYDGDDEHDYVEEVYKRGAYVSFYIHKASDDTYALVSAYQDYDNGRDRIEIQKEGLKRVEKIIPAKIEFAYE